MKILAEISWSLNLFEKNVKNERESILFSDLYNNKRTKTFLTQKVAYVA